MIDYVMIATIIISIAIVLMTCFACYLLYKLIRTDDGLVLYDKLDLVRSKVDYLESQIEHLEDRVEALIEDCDHVS